MQAHTALVLVVLAVASSPCRSQEAIVASGHLLGERMAGAGGARDYIAFRGVPYAAPPVGDLRFRAPRPAVPWNGVRNATMEGNVCPQISGGKVLGSEDCLNLNVYTPSLTCPPTRYAVIVFFHGGFFIELSSSEDPYNGPDFFVHHDVVLVVPNFRLGPLGFLNMDTAAVPGNAGAKDAVAVLRWVKENIRAFCGDSEKVTVMGQSAGAKLASFLGLSEMARGLFRASIQLSGVANGRIAYTEENKATAVALAAELGNQDDSLEAVQRFLLAASWEDLTRHARRMFEESAWDVALNPFVLSRELRPKDEEPVFMTRDPDSSIANPPWPRVPTLTGVVSREGYLASLGVMTNSTHMEALNRAFGVFLIEEALLIGTDTAAKYGVGTTPHSNLVAKIEEMVKTVYFGGQNPSTDFPEGMANLIGDIRYVYPLYRWATQLDSHQSAPLYLYLFDQIAEFNFAESHIPNFNHVPGAFHTDDLGYLFHLTSDQDIQDITGDGRANRTLRAHTKLITDFAKDLSSPVLEGGNIVGRRERPPYLYIADFYQTRVENTLGAEARMALWDEVMALILNKNSTNQASSLSRPGILATITGLALVLAALR